MLAKFLKEALRSIPDNVEITIMDQDEDIEYTLADSFYYDAQYGCGSLVIDESVSITYDDETQELSEDAVPPEIPEEDIIEEIEGIAMAARRVA